MSPKKRILLILSYERPDHFDYLIKSGGDRFEWILLWNYKETNPHPMPGLRAISWSDYSTPKQLIDQVRPDKIVFGEIIDMWQIPLIVHAKKRNVTTFYLAHGMYKSQSEAIKRFAESASARTFGAYLKKLSSSFSRILKNRVYYYSVLTDMNSIRSLFSYVTLPAYYKLYDPIEVMSKMKFPERTVDYALLFCENNVPFFKLFNDIAPDRVLTGGFPPFDAYYKKDGQEGDYVVFIEHPYLELNQNGWDRDFHSRVAQGLFDFSVSNNIKVVVKLHPVSNIENWKNYGFPPENIEIIQSQVSPDLYLNAKLILGFSSTLLIAFLCAQKNVVFLGWHPVPQVSGVDFSETGLCHVSFDIDDLRTQYHKWIAENLTKQKPQEYNSFVKTFNYPFDGRATERVLNDIYDH